MPSITGIRDGHRIITTVTRHPDHMTVTRGHHPHCPCQPMAIQPQTEEPSMPDQPSTPAWPTFTLQRWDWTTRAWETHGTYESERGEDNAYFAVSSERASGTGPIRLLKDGVPVFADDPDTYYSDPA